MQISAVCCSDFRSDPTPIRAARPGGSQLTGEGGGVTAGVRLQHPLPVASRPALSSSRSGEISRANSLTSPASLLGGDQSALHLSGAEDPTCGVERAMVPPWPPVLSGLSSGVLTHAGDVGDSGRARSRPRRRHGRSGTPQKPRDDRGHGDLGQEVEPRRSSRPSPVNCANAKAVALGWGGHHQDRTGRVGAFEGPRPAPARHVTAFGCMSAAARHASPCAGATLIRRTRPPSPRAGINARC